MTTPTSFIDSGLQTILTGYQGQFVATVKDWVGIIIPATLAVWAIKVPVFKGVGWMKRQVFGR